jgi:hypothetical protein
MKGEASGAEESLIHNKSSIIREEVVSRPLSKKSLPTVKGYKTKRESEEKVKIDYLTPMRIKRNLIDIKRPSAAPVSDPSIISNSI